MERVRWGSSGHSRWGSSGHPSGLRTTKGKTSVNNGCRKGTRHPHGNHGNISSETSPNESSLFEGKPLSSIVGPSSRGDVVTGVEGCRGSGGVFGEEGREVSPSPVWGRLAVAAPPQPLLVM